MRWIIDGTEFSGLQIKNQTFQLFFFELETRVFTVEETKPRNFPVKY